MKKSINLLLLILVLPLSLFGQSLESRGVPTYPYPTKVVQPNGEVVVLRGYGDGAVHWYETENGYTVLRNEEGYYSYAQLNSNGEMVASKTIVQGGSNLLKSAEIQKLGIKPGLHFSKQQVENQLNTYQMDEATQLKSFPTTGVRKVLLILVDFQDLKQVLPPSDIDHIMNQENYNGTGSFKDFYLTNSYGQVELVTTVTQWVTVSNNMSYYGQNDANHRDMRPRELVREAIDQLDARGFDFSPFDNDGDGETDGILVIHAGYGEEYTGAPSDAIWSHRWELGYQLAPTYDGVRINSYAIFPELSGYTGSKPTNIGVICHEFGHVLGLLDYYDTDYNSSGGLSWHLEDWDVMASGTWNNNGATPANHNAYSKALLGWLSLKELSTPKTIKLNNSGEYPEGCLIKTNVDGEFFVLENRQQVGFDKYIPHHGMLIYHIDRNYNGWLGNRINANPEHQGFDLLEADNVQSYRTFNGDPFPGVENVTAFDDNTIPSSKTWSGEETGKPINNIEESNSVVSFDFIGGDEAANGSPWLFTVTPVSESQIDITWQLNQLKNPVLIAYSKDGTFGMPENSRTYSAGEEIPGGGRVIYYGSAESYNHTGLEKGTKYYYSAWSKKDAEYTFSTTANAETDGAIFNELPYSEDFNGKVKPQNWTVVDNLNPGNVWEFDNPKKLKIYTETASNGFAIVVADYHNRQDEPANSDLISPEFNFGAYDSINLEFQHYYKAIAGSRGDLYYSIDNGNNWTLIVELWRSTENAEKYIKDLSVELAGKDQVRFKWHYHGTSGWHWAIDDIKITGVKSQGNVGGIATNMHEENEDQIVVYPNPTKGMVYIRPVKNIDVQEITIFNASSQVVYQNKDIANNFMNINLQDMPKGIYYIVIKGKDATITKSIMVR